MNKQEIANEVAVLLCSYLLLCYTEFVPESKTRYQVGWAHMCIIGFNVLMNLGIMLCVIFSNCKRSCRIKYARRHALAAAQNR